MPSRLEVDEYQRYLDELMAAAGRINARYGDSQWEPVRLLVGEDYPRAVAALQSYDVLLVNSIADGMNLVAKEGPIVNQREGVLVLSERTGARQQLEPGAIVIAPCDVYATAEALHQALTMPAPRREEFAARLRWVIEREDLQAWLHQQSANGKRLESMIALHQRQTIALLHYSAPPVIGGVEAVLSAHADALLAAQYPVTIITGRGDSLALPTGAELVVIPNWIHGTRSSCRSARRSSEDEFLQTSLA